MNFAIIDSVLPEDLADRVARVAHKTSYDQVCHDIQSFNHNIISLFDEAIREGRDNIQTYITNKFGDKVKVVVDDWMDWYTIMFIFPETGRFALYHHYVDMEYVERYLIDGSFTNDTVNIERYVFYDENFTSYTDVFPNALFVPIKNLYPKGHTYHVDFSKVGSKRWIDPETIFEAFNEIEYANFFNLDD